MPKITFTKQAQVLIEEANVNIQDFQKWYNENVVFNVNGADIVGYLEFKNKQNVNK